MLMANQNKNRKNQPPTGEGKKQNPRPGESAKLSKRSEVAQAQRGHPEENIATDDSEEMASRDEHIATPPRPARKKAGR